MGKEEIALEEIAPAGEVVKVDIDGGAETHAETLFQSMQAQLGGEMPAAPVRMLGLFGDDQTSTPSTSTGGSHDASFMECVSKAVPNPTKVCSCIANNMSTV